MRTFFLLVIFLVVGYLGYEAVRVFVDARIGRSIAIHTTPFEKGTGSRTMLVLGDSTAVGVGTSNGASSVPGRLAEALDASVENHAKSGAVVADLAAQLAEAKLEQYDLVLIQAGANDIIHFHDLSRANTDMDALLAAAREKSLHVVLLTAGKVGDAPIFPWFWKPLLNHRSAVLRDLFKQTASAHGAVYVDLFSEKDPMSADPKRFYALDGLHLTDAGYARWYDATKNAIASTWPEFLHE